MQRDRHPARTIARPAQAATDQNVNFSRYGVATRKQLDVDNYARAKLTPLRLVSEKIIRSAALRYNYSMNEARKRL
jgi:hypothetical protein